MLQNQPTCFRKRQESILFIYLSFLAPPEAIVFPLTRNISLPGRLGQLLSCIGSDPFRFSPHKYVPIPVKMKIPPINWDG